MRGHRTKKRDESAAWKAVARETLRAFDLIMTPALHGHTQQTGARAAMPHLERGRLLLQPIIDRHVADARTPMGRAGRKRRIARGAYVQAFAQAIAHASARTAGEPEPGWPILYTRGALPLIDRYTGDRRILNEAEDQR
ncbi:hypothetical protein ACWD3I_25755 [Streptomyces sp. NPDC002817]|uniref:hypothetical protein n=1 Tax=Streptomyces sp. NPDC088357 TaxID=3154655 RepID=UPI003447AD6E